ncbi:helix-turn-helix domain-containing protein [Periweissella fabalis]|uniref:Helix-turn-helix transcriptional regulator n=1 Tax=Periweissella fabalis TaxID=1070421 RepID=A0A7X6N2T7_9LACO|nr:helix-turn-helix transcriptional regulator [Periweissella fabalis]MCM0598125.1 helix-turn-helix transcriptional regulator [Periweissella fabalis]NKZ24751.1 helix-turn-helix transcriptional regulator [Periweissella fabalis]
MLIDELLKQESNDKTFMQGYQMEKAKLASAVSLYKAREEAGLTQMELAEMAGTTQATIARIERGDNVSFEKLSQLAQAMDKKLSVSFT